MSVPAARDRRTRSDNPIAASQAPMVRSKIHISLMFMPFHTKRTGTMNTRLSMIPSNISRDIRRCVCCNMKAKSMISGVSCSSNMEEAIDSRSEPVFDLQGRCFFI